MENHKGLRPIKRTIVGLEVGIRMRSDWKTELYYKVKDKTKQNSNDEDIEQNQE